MIGESYPNAMVITMSYDAADQLLSSLAPSGQTTSYTYDLQGNRQTRTGPQNTLTTYGYDQANRLTAYAGPAAKTINGITAGTTVQATYAYDGDGLRLAKGVDGALIYGALWDQAEGMPLLVEDFLINYVTDPLGLPLERVQADGEVRAVSGLGRSHSQTDGQVGLPDAGWTEEDDVAMLLDEAQGGELGDDLPVDRQLEVEVEVGECLVDGVTGKAQPAAGVLDLEVQKALQNLSRSGLLAQGPVQLGAEMLGRGGQLEVCEVLPQSLV